MKKEMKTKKLFALAILSLFLFNILAISLVSAASSNKITDWASNFYNNYLKPEQGYDAFGIEELQNPDIIAMITIIGVIVFASIIFEVAYLLPLSTFTDMLIGSGALIIIISLKLMRTWISYMMIILASLFGLGGTIGMLMTGVIFVVLAFATFTGSQMAHKWIDKIRYNKELQTKKKRAYEAASSVEALNTEAKSIFNKGLFKRD